MLAVWLSALLLALPPAAQEPSPEAIQKQAREALGKLPELIEAGKGADEAARKDANTRLKLAATLLLTELNRSGTTNAQVDRTFQQIARIGAPALGPLDTFIDTCKKLADEAINRVGPDADPVVHRLNAIRHRAESERIPLVALADRNRARQEYIEALDRRYMFTAKNYGRDSVPFGQAALELGDAYFRDKRYYEAENCLNPAREAFAAQTGEAALPEIDCLFRLAVISRSRKKFDHARILARRWMNRAEALLKEGNPSMALAHLEFGHLEFDAGDFEAAADRYRRALEILRKAQDIPPTHVPDVLIDFYGPALEKWGRLDEAAGAYQENLDHRRRLHGDKSREVALASHVLGLLERNRKEYARAEPLLAEAVKIRLDLLGPDDLDTARSRAALGRLYMATGERGKAEPLLRSVLATREMKLGPDHPDTKAAAGYLEELRSGGRK